MRTPRASKQPTAPAAANVSVVALARQIAAQRRIGLADAQVLALRELQQHGPVAVVRAKDAAAPAIGPNGIPQPRVRGDYAASVLQDQPSPNGRAPAVAQASGDRQKDEGIFETTLDDFLRTMIENGIAPAVASNVIKCLVAQHRAGAQQLTARGGTRVPFIAGPPMPLPRS